MAATASALAADIIPQRDSSKPQVQKSKNDKTTTQNVIAGKLMVGLGTLVTVLLGATMRGDWILILVHIWKQFEDKDRGNATSSTLDDLPPRNLLENVHWFVLLSVAVSFVSYYSLGGYLQWYFYIKRRDQAKEWKCQPNKFLTQKDERHEILLGSLCMGIGGTISGVLACYILNGGYTTLYFRVSDHGWPYLLLSIPLVFLYHDASAYYMHRLFHYPFIYKRIHKHHHRYHQPTAFSAVAMHPLEFLTFQTLVAAPLFFIRVYSGVFIGLVLYAYYYGMMDHSGIMMDAIWPWQPPVIFHDNHHKYFHVNFGFNSKLWDWLHDTLRKDDRVYGENIFYGRGKQNGKVE